MEFGGMRESSTIKLSVKFHALYHIKLVSAGRKVFLSPVKQKVDFCIIICPKRKSSVHHSSRTWVARQMVKMEVKHETKGNL